MNQFRSRESSRFLASDAQGPRDEQQDAILHLSTPHGTALLVVSDGVGGNSGGRIASQAVVDSTREFWTARNGNFGDPWEDLDTLCHLAHREINRRGAKRGLSPRATVVAVYLTPFQAFWVHCGDSRLYHFRSGKLVKRTEDHSVVQILVKQGMLTEEQMGEHPDQGRLLQSLGGEEYTPPTRGTAKLTARDAILLCTDGFWERTKVGEMAEVLFGPRSTAAVRLRQAVERAVKRNGPKGDNVSVAVALPSEEAAAKGTLPTPRKLIPVLVGVLFLLLLALSVFLGLPRHRHHQKAVGTPGASPHATAGMPGVSPHATAGTPGASPHAAAGTPGASPYATAGTPGVSPYATADTPGTSPYATAVAPTSRSNPEQKPSPEANPAKQAPTPSSASPEQDEIPPYKTIQSISIDGKLPNTPLPNTPDAKGD